MLLGPWSDAGRTLTWGVTGSFKGPAFASLRATLFDPAVAEPVISHTFPTRTTDFPTPLVYMFEINLYLYYWYTTCLADLRRKHLARLRRYISVARKQI